MHSPTRVERLLFAAAVLALLPSCGGAPASTGGVPPGGALSAQRMLAGHTVAQPSYLTRFPQSVTATIPIGVKIPPGQHPIKLPLPVPPTCDAVYLSDTSSQIINVYRETPPFGMLGTLSGYGQGVAADRQRIYAGQAVADKVDEFAPCSSKLVGTLTGKLSAPSIVAVDSKGTVYDAHFGSTSVEIFADGGPSFYIATAPSPPFGLSIDSHFDIYLSGWNVSLSNAEVSLCTPGLKSCGSFAELPSPSFPGGVTVAKNGNVIADDQNGTLYTYNSAGVLLHSFTYNNGANPLDYTAIALNGDGKELWGANIYLCTSSFGICGDAQAQKYSRSGKVGPLRGATAGTDNAEPGAIAVFPPSPM